MQNMKCDVWCKMCDVSFLIFVRSWFYESRGDQKYPIWVIFYLLSDIPQLVAVVCTLYLAWPQVCQRGRGDWSPRYQAWRRGLRCQEWRRGKRCQAWRRGLPWTHTGRLRWKRPTCPLDCATTCELVCENPHLSNCFVSSTVSEFLY